MSSFIEQKSSQATTVWTAGNITSVLLDDSLTKDAKKQSMAIQITKALAPAYASIAGSVFSSLMAFYFGGQGGECGILGQFYNGTFSLMGNVLVGRVGNQLHDWLNYNTLVPGKYLDDERINDLTVLAIEYVIADQINSEPFAQFESDALNNLRKAVRSVWFSLLKIDGFAESLNAIKNDATLLHPMANSGAPKDGFWNTFIIACCKSNNIQLDEPLKESLTRKLSQDLPKAVREILVLEASNKDPHGRFQEHLIKSLEIVSSIVHQIAMEQAWSSDELAAIQNSLDSIRKRSGNILIAIGQFHESNKRRTKEMHSDLRSGFQDLSAGTLQFATETRAMLNRLEETVSTLSLNTKRSDAKSVLPGPNHSASNSLPQRLQLILSSEAQYLKATQQSLLSLDGITASRLREGGPTAAEEVNSYLHLIESLIGSQKSTLTRTPWDVLTPADIFTICKFSIVRVSVAWADTHALAQAVVYFSRDSKLSLLWKHFLKDAVRSCDSVAFGSWKGKVKEVVLNEASSLDPTSEISEGLEQLLRSFAFKHCSTIITELLNDDGELRLIKQFFEPSISLVEVDDPVLSIFDSISMPIRDWLDTTYQVSGAARFSNSIHPAYLACIIHFADELYPVVIGDPQVGFKRSPFPFRYLPTERISLREVVQAVAFGNSDPEALTFEIRKTAAIDYFNCKDQLLDLQSRLDASWAILGEYYGDSPKFAGLGMSIRRLKIREVNVRPNQVDFLDIRASFTIESPASILRTLVEPLYGDRPEVGIRELLQNAVDATRERCLYQTQNAHEHDHKMEPILVHFNRRTEGDPWSFGGIPEWWEYWVTVSDQGVGMDEYVITEYFLKAAASYRRDIRWLREFSDIDGSPMVNRIGRFGVGAFAAFLLGDEVHVRTRHFNADGGLEFTTKLNDDLIEIRRIVCGAGTSVSVRLTERMYQYLLSNQLNGGERSCKWAWYRSPLPQVAVRVGVDDSVPMVSRREYPEKLDSHLIFPLIDQKLKTSRWSYSCLPKLTVNGMVVGTSANDPRSVNRFSDKLVNHFFHVPNLEVADLNNDLPMTLARDQFYRDLLPCEPALVESVIYCYIASLIYFLPTCKVVQGKTNISAGITPKLPRTYKEILPSQLHRLFRQEFDCPRWLLVGNNWQPFGMPLETIRFGCFSRSNIEVWDEVSRFQNFWSLSSDALGKLDIGMLNQLLGIEVEAITFCAARPKVIGQPPYRRSEKSGILELTEGVMPTAVLDKLKREFLRLKAEKSSIEFLGDIYLKAPGFTENRISSTLIELGLPDGIPVDPVQRQQAAAPAYKRLKPFFDEFRKLARIA